MKIILIKNQELSNVSVYDFIKCSITIVQIFKTRNYIQGCC